MGQVLVFCRGQEAIFKPFSKTSVEFIKFFEQENNIHERGVFGFFFCSRSEIIMYLTRNEIHKKHSRDKEGITSPRKVESEMKKELINFNIAICPKKT